VSVFSFDRTYIEIKDLDICNGQEAKILTPDWLACVIITYLLLISCCLNWLSYIAVECFIPSI